MTDTSNEHVALFDGKYSQSGNRLTYYRGVFRA